MRILNRVISTIFSISLLIACQQSTDSNESTETNSVLSSEEIPAERDVVKTEPVASYDEPAGDGLNNWHFTATLYETKERFRYLLNMKYQEVTASDTIRFPNFGMEPKPQLIKGENKHECILGFLDRQGNFREYVKVYVENGDLRVKTLKHYSVVATE